MGLNRLADKDVGLIRMTARLPKLNRSSFLVHGST